MDLLFSFIGVKSQENDDKLD